MNKAAVVILLALVLASSAYGMVFSWTDSAGSRKNKKVQAFTSEGRVTDIVACGEMSIK